MPPKLKPNTTRLLLLAAALAVVAGLAFWRLSGPQTPDPTGQSGSAIAPQVSRPGPSWPRPTRATLAPRDSDLDREFTTSREALTLYEQGVTLASGQPVQSAARFRGAVLLDPDFGPAHYRLAIQSITLSRADEAARELKLAIARDERLPEPYRTAAPVLAHYVDGAFDLTAQTLGEAFARQPADPDLHWVAGSLAARSCDHFDPNAIIEHLEPLSSSAEDLRPVRRMLVDAYELKGMNDWALSRALEFKSSNPDLAEADSELGRVRLARGEYGDAIELSDEVLRRGGDLFAHGLAPAFILSGHQEQLAVLYDPEMEATNTPVANALTHLHAGINDVWLGRFDRAIRHFERGPEFAQAPWDRSDKALFYLLLGRTYALLGRNQEAHAAFQAAQQAVGPLPVLEYALGMSELAAGRIPEAERVVRRLSRETHVLEPGWTEPWRRLMTGEIALASGDAAGAVGEVREAWNLARPLAVDCVASHVEAYFLDALGRCFLASRRPAEALEAFEEIRSLGIKGLHQPEIVILAEYHSAQALEALGKPDEARKRYREFLGRWGSTGEALAEVRAARLRSGGP
ncbi:MAG TPA: hypothetical protein VFG76_06360 [Candidatus Polarisedimenticolia bacterium]|nr:hypothetical protein [Candidatus Polarisedimenticolia bacterium]